MIRRQVTLSLAAAAALAFSGTAHALRQAPSAVSPPAAGQQSSSSSDSSQRTRPTTDGTHLAAAGNVSAGMPVRTVSGEPLGAVRDVVPDTRGDPGYVLITLSRGGKTAVPYTTASALMRNGTIVFDRARLEGAPRVQDSQLQNLSDKSWQKQADQYWSPRGSMPSSEPGRSKGGASTPDQG